MARITDLDVSTMNDRIAQADSTGAAFAALAGCSRRMLELLMDLNHISPDCGGREARVWEIAKAHGWSPGDREDFAPADGRGPCDLGRFEAHSRRPSRCRRCDRRPIDHRPVRPAS